MLDMLYARKFWHFLFKMLFKIVYNFAKIKLVVLEFPCMSGAGFVHFKVQFLGR